MILLIPRFVVSYWLVAPNIKNHVQSLTSSLDWLVTRHIKVARSMIRVIPGLVVSNWRASSDESCLKFPDSNGFCGG